MALTAGKFRGIFLQARLHGVGTPGRKGAPLGRGIQIGRRAGNGVQLTLHVLDQVGHGPQKPPGIGVAGAVKYLPRVAVLHDLARIHHGDPVGHLGHYAQIMGNEQYGPVYKEEWNFPADENVMEHIKAITKGIRNVRAEMDVPNSRKTKVYVVCQDEALCNGIEGMTESVKPLMNANEIIIEQTKEGVADNAVSVVVPDAVVYLPLEDLVDFEQELERLKKEEDRLNKEIKRAEGMLANERFVSKAPADKVQAERDKLEKYTEMLAQVKERMEGLGK